MQARALRARLGPFICLLSMFVLAVGADTGGGGSACGSGQYDFSDASDGSQCAFCPGFTDTPSGAAGVVGCTVRTNTWSVVAPGRAGVNGSTDSAVPFAQPMGVDFVGGSTRILVTDARMHTVSEYDLANFSAPPTVIAGQTGSIGVCLEASCSGHSYADNSRGADARFTVPTHVRVAPGGRYAFVSDTRAGAVRRIDLGDSERYTDTVLTNWALHTPYDIAFTSDARFIFVADPGHHVVYRWWHLPCAPPAPSVRCCNPCCKGS